MKNVLKITAFSLVLVFGVIASAPKAHAVTFNPMNPIDPFCLFSCPKPQPTNVTNTINSNNSNSFNNTTTVGTNNGTVNSPYTVSGSGSGTSMRTDAYIPPAVNSGSYTATSPYSVSNTTVLPSTPSANTNTNYNYNVNGGGSTYTPTPVYYSQPVYSQPTYYQEPTYYNPTYYTQPYQNPVYVQPYQQPVIYNQPISYAPSIEIACAADKTYVQTGVPVTWSAEATYQGMGSGFAYSWSGTEGLFGNQASTIIAYYSNGIKSAVVTVTAPNGVQASKVCSNTVKVGAAVAKTPVKVAAAPKATVKPTPTPEVSAAALFSLGNVPWGWVGVLIILVLLGIIFYLIFNKKKI
jgi:hypothetical protein